MKPFSSLRPIFSALRRHKAAVTLLVLEIALTMAVLGNLLFIVNASMRLEHERTGVMGRDIGVIQSIGVIGTPNPGTAAGNIDLLDRVPGVVAASFGAVPFAGVSTYPVYADPGLHKRLAAPYLFEGAQGYAKTLGVQVIAGRLPREDELPSSNAKIDPGLITQALAQRLYPQQSPLGRMLYLGQHGGGGVRIVGVMRELRGSITGRNSDSDSILLEAKVGNQNLGGLYLIRSQPGQLKRVLPLAAKALQKANPGHVTSMFKTMVQIRQMVFRSASAINRILMAITAILLIVTALGVSGLASFWVQQRTRHIGTRRALGATRGRILRHFQAENLIIVSMGVALGAALTIGLNVLLMQRFAQPRLPLQYVAFGALAMWLLGQLAVLGPALRAARVPPTTAMRAA
ncbi:FtsX-like permease family protein [Metallibacterium sp.]|uniref:ABC transporter permease n=1 Tax=Metallibacterium sp. TaxID=2940281 RepID=UPI00262115F3|nr:FtsX-like permease family protein [Metallibacterium sp.]